MADEGRPEIVRVVTHGQGYYGRVDESGHLSGVGIDYLSCAMASLGQGYTVNVMSMARAKARDGEGIYDIWFPIIGDGRPEVKAHFVGPIGTMSLYWFRRKGDGREMDKKLKVSAFPGSSAAELLDRADYNHIGGSDNASVMVVRLLKGELDAILAPDFRSVLAPGARMLSDELTLRPFAELPVGYLLARDFDRKYPAFKADFQAAVETCVMSSEQVPAGE